LWYTDDLVSKITWLYNEGKGKTLEEIATMLKICRSVVQKNMACGKNPQAMFFCK
jgi:DNA-binding transcriptional regulator LsrR (DeoR family)